MRQTLSGWAGMAAAASSLILAATKEEVFADGYPDFPGHWAGMPVKPAIPENRVATQSPLSKRAGH